MNLFYIVVGLWIASEVVLNRMLHSGKSDKQGADKNSLNVIWITIVIAVAAAIYISFALYAAIGSQPLIYYVGSGIMVVGILLRFIAIYTLGKFFTVDVTIREGHQLVKRGMYKYFRHPSYTASLLTFIGFGLLLNNWISLAIVTVAIYVVFQKRIRVEENALTAQFGDEYLQYKKEAYGLVPFIY